MIERPVNVGDRVKAGQVLAKLDPETELSALRSAESALIAAQGQLTYAHGRISSVRGSCWRMATRLGPGSITHKRHCKSRSLRSTTPRLGWMVLFAVFFWGMLWGVAGAFIGVPILLAVAATCARSASARPIAVLLSADNGGADP